MTGSAAKVRTIAIVGAGLAGTLVAINVLRGARRATRVVLADRTGTFGRGVAYAERDFPYMLNVPASAMSATAGAPDEFLHFAQRQFASARGEDFMPRALYGAYLGDLLDAAIAAARPGVALSRYAAAVVDIGSNAQPGLRLADGTWLPADEVVLALGNPPAADPFPPPGLAGVHGVRPDPWTRVTDADLSRPLLILGSGLTMADVVCDSVAQAPERPIYVLSRHGFVPPEQTNFRRTPLTVAAAPLTPGPSARALVAAARRLTAEIEASGGDWRTAIATIRHEAPSLWHALPHAERRRFLRHARSHWDRLRHRLPGAVRARIEALHAKGQLHLYAGRLLGVTAGPDGLAVRWQRRGQTLARELHVGEIANCTGPDYDVRRSNDPLWQRLLAAGRVTADDLGLGLHTSTHGALVGADGHLDPHVYYIGPMLRADHWEVTAAAELRAHAEALARHLLVQDLATN